MEYFALAAVVFVATVTVRDAWAAGGDDPNWDLHWRALAPEDRARLAAAGLSAAATEKLADPEERGLAEGFGRRERRRRAYLDLVLLAALAFMAALVLAGIVAGSEIGLVLAAYASLAWAIRPLRDRQIKRRAPVEPDAAPAP